MATYMGEGRPDDCQECKDMATERLQWMLMSTPLLANAYNLGHGSLPAVFRNVLLSGVGLDTALRSLYGRNLREEPTHLDYI